MEHSPLHQLSGRTVWEVLEGLHQIAFTGEVALDTQPAVRVYTSRGAVYLAESVEMPPVHERLVAAGAMSTEQLDQGAVSLGSGLHLGRMFDRNRTIDRDRVELTLDAANSELLAGVADQHVSAIVARALRHHPSGVHLWGAAVPPVRRRPQLGDAISSEPSVEAVFVENPSVESAIAEGTFGPHEVAETAPPELMPAAVVEPPAAMPVAPALPLATSMPAPMFAPPSTEPVTLAAPTELSATPPPAWSWSAATAPTIEQVALLEMEPPISSLSSEEIWDAVDQLTVQPDQHTPDADIEPTKRGWLRRR